MKLSKASYEIIGEPPRKIDLGKKFIEVAGRICYKSEDAITDNSVIKFIKMIVNSGHHSVIEHSNLVMVIRSPTIPIETRDQVFLTLGERMKFHKVEIARGNVYIAGNYRAWHQTREAILGQDQLSIIGIEIVEAISINLDGIFDYDSDEKQVMAYGLIQTLSDKEEIPERLRQYTVRIVCDRGVAHEIVRHRGFAYSQESTRYVNYNNRGMTFIIPVWAKNVMPKNDFEGISRIDRENYDEFEMRWVSEMLEAEGAYRDLGDTSKPGYWTPEKCRSVLPNSTKTEIIITGFIEDWDWMRHMRVPKTAHPQYREISIPLFNEFEEKGWLSPLV